MTLENCQQLLIHYEKLANGEGIPPQHKHKQLLMKNMKVAAEEMKLRIARKMNGATKLIRERYGNPELEKEEPKPEPKVEVKKSGKK